MPRVADCGATTGARAKYCAECGCRIAVEPAATAAARQLHTPRGR